MVEKKNIRVNGYTYMCLIAGSPDNPAIIMIHGWAHHPEIWLNTIESHQKHYYCVAVGVLGLGESDKPTDGDYRIESHARDTLLIADELGIDRFILLGQSRGGQIALSLASQIAPERVIQLVNISGVCSGDLSFYMRWIMRSGIWLNSRFYLAYRLARYLFSYQFIAQLYYSPYFANIWKRPAHLTVQDLHNGLREDSRITNFLCMETMMNTDLRPHLHKIIAPTLIIFGVKDRVVLPEQGKIAASMIQNSRLVLLEDCGHFPMLETPETYLSALNNFIQTPK